MATYKHESGETVILADGSWEDTRVGSLALDRKGGWSKVEDAKVDDSEPEQPTAPAAPTTATAKPKPKVEG